MRAMTQTPPNAAFVVAFVTVPVTIDVVALISVCEVVMADETACARLTGSVIPNAINPGAVAIKLTPKPVGAEWATTCELATALSLGNAPTPAESDAVCWAFTVDAKAANRTTEPAPVAINRFHGYFDTRKGFKARAPNRPSKRPPKARRKAPHPLMARRMHELRPHPIELSRYANVTLIFRCA
jgi:hypothetical protein